MARAKWDNGLSTISKMHVSSFPKLTGLLEPQTALLEVLTALFEIQIAVFEI
jgi:hypothetical protein